MNAAEKKAAALPPKLTVPMILFFLPVLFAIILGPAGIQVSERGIFGDQPTVEQPIAAGNACESAVLMQRGLDLEHDDECRMTGGSAPVRRCGQLVAGFVLSRP